MKKIIFFASVLLTLFIRSEAQEIIKSADTSVPAKLLSVIKTDSLSAFEKMMGETKVNSCDGNYSLLSQTIRYNAIKCFNLLMVRGANVNFICNGYVSPLMHAVKYGRLDMVKALVKKGADLKFRYEGSSKEALGHTPLSYAEKFHQTEILSYLNSLK